MPPLYTFTRETVLVDYVGSDDMTVFLPRGGSDGHVPLIYAHGALVTGTGAFVRDRGDTGDDLKALATCGIPAAAADLDGPTTWGRDAAWGRISDTVTALATNFGTRTDKVNLMGDSMGALNVLNWAWRNPTKVGRVALRSPVVSLAAFRNRNVGTFGTAIEDAYGGLSPFTAALPTHDPSDPSIIAMLRDGVGPRVKLWYATSDDLIPTGEVIAFARAVGAEAVSTPGEHGDGVDQPVDDLVEWLAG